MSSTIIRVIISLVILAVIFLRMDVDVYSLLAAVKNPVCLAAAFLIPFTLMPIFSINRWKLFLGMSGIKEKFSTLFTINYIAQFHGMILPSAQGQDVFRIYQIEKRHPEKRGQAGSTVLIERMFGLILLILFSLFSLPFAAESGDVRMCAVLISASAVLTFAAVAAVCTPWGYRLYVGHRTRFDIINKAIDYLEKVHRSMITFPYRKVILSSVFFIAGFQLSTVLIVYLLFCACGCYMPFFDHLALFPLIAILTMIPVTIAGFGIREGFFIYFYCKMGITPPTALTVSLTYYILTGITPSLFGGLIWLISKNYTTPKKNDRNI